MCVLALSLSLFLRAFVEINAGSKDGAQLVKVNGAPGGRIERSGVGNGRVSAGWEVDDE